MGNIEDSCSVDRHYSQMEEGLYYVLNLDGSVLFLPGSPEISTYLQTCFTRQSLLHDKKLT